MAKTITQLPDATTVGASDEMIVQQGGITKRATINELKTEVAAFGANDITVSSANRSITNTTNHALSFGTNNTERVRIDNAGNVGIGTASPSSFNGRFNVKTSDAAVIGYFGGTTYATRIGSNANFATVESVDAATGASSYQPMQLGCSLLSMATGGAERMRIDASGNVGIGTSSPSAKLDCRGDATVTNGTNGVSLRGAEGCVEMFRSGSDAYIDFKTTAGEDFDARIQQASNGLAILTGGEGSTAERIRIDASGNVGIGTTSPAYTLHVNGSVAGTSAYNNLSDVREKENIVYGIADALDTVKALKPAKFDFKEGDKGKIGFIAQDVQPLVPEVITSYEKTLPDDTKEERLSIQESSLTAVLVAAIQELTAKVEALEAAANA